MTETGLRETKRQATALALAETAFHLAKERGLDGFTIDEVTAQAVVSRRTFANYYSCKEEAVGAYVIEQLNTGIQTMPDLPDSTPLLDWVKALAQHQLSGGTLELLRVLRELAVQSPSFEPYLANVHAKIRRTAQAVVGARAGGGNVSQMTAHILVGAAYGALTAVLERQFVANTGPDSNTDSFLDSVFNQLRSGL